MDPGKLNAAGAAYSAESGELATLAARVETEVTTGKVGRAWTDVAGRYAEVVARHGDTIGRYADGVSELGAALTAAAGGYEKGEDVGADVITRSGSR
ncbi:type VII secretion target [Amycolatopsis arida]|uniref:type VII secretion target n=1 Tax=Amycolatopsis arida TaxID=587909 RepID=UPI001FB916A9|nr:type VII secretion target [Amycolatopsis arida]